MSNIITNIVWGISGFIIGGFLTYKFRVLWYKRTKFIDACIEFNKTFLKSRIYFSETNNKGSIVEEIAYGTPSISDFIESQITIQEEAYFSLLHYFRGRKRKRFEKAWQNYAHPNNDSPFKKALNRFSVYRVKRSEQNEVRKLVKNKIDKLLNFTKKY